MAGQGLQQFPIALMKLCQPTVREGVPRGGKMLSAFKQGVGLSLCRRERESAFCRSSFSWHCSSSC